MVGAPARIDLGFTPRPWQAEVLGKLKRWNVLVVHRRGGKTLLAVMLLINEALRTRKQLSRYAYVAPWLKQAKGIAWDYLRLTALKVPGCKVNASELWVQFPNGARIQLFGADNPDALRGRYLDGVVVDETAQVKPDVWYEVIGPQLADRLGWCLFIGTPKGINLLHELYHRALKDDEWFADCWRWDETDALPRDEVLRWRARQPERVFQQEFECSFTAAALSQLIAFDAVQAAAGRVLRESDWKLAPLVAGVDVARAPGGARSVIFPRRGLQAFAPRWWTGLNNMAFADEIAAYWDEKKPDAVFIDAGQGYGVIDRLRQLGYDPLAVDFGGSASNPFYRNKRAEMWDAINDWLAAGGSLPDLAEVKADLVTPLCDVSSLTGKLILESKKAITERGLPSPDFGDALAATFAAPVRARPRQAATGGEDRIEAHYDPFADRKPAVKDSVRHGYDPFEGRKGRSR